MFRLMSQDVGNKKNSWANSGNAKSNEFERRTGRFLFQSRKSSPTKPRMIHLLLALLSPMTKSVIVILLLNSHMQNQREISLRMLCQHHRKAHFHQRHLPLIQREHQFHQILHQREQNTSPERDNSPNPVWKRDKNNCLKRLKLNRELYVLTCGRQHQTPMEKKLSQKRKRLNYKK